MFYVFSLIKKDKASVWLNFGKIAHFPTKSVKILNRDFWKLPLTPPAKMTLQATIVPLSIWGFCLSISLVSLLFVGNRNYANGGWALWRKNVDIFHPCCPLNTHASCSHHSASFLLAQFGGPVSFGCLSSILKQLQPYCLRLSSIHPWPFYSE